MYCSQSYIGKDGRPCIILIYIDISCEIRVVYNTAYRSLTVTRLATIHQAHSTVNSNAQYDRDSSLQCKIAFIPVIRGSMSKFLHLHINPQNSFLQGSLSPNITFLGEKL